MIEGPEVETPVFADELDDSHLELVAPPNHPPSTTLASSCGRWLVATPPRCGSSSSRSR